MNYIVPEHADVRTILRNLKECDGTVSYTHLTLPTICSV